MNAGMGKAVTLASKKTQADYLIHLNSQCNWETRISQVKIQ
jgi:hypothetical protein